MSNKGNIMQTEAAVLWELNAPWSVETIELDPPKAGEVLVELHASGMCHSDEHLVTGDLPGALPMIGGHEGAGVVLEVGEGVTNVAPGDHVVFSFVPACGHCPSCASGHSNLCDNGAALLIGIQLDGTTRHHGANGEDIYTMVCLGTFAKHTVVNAISCVKIDDGHPARARLPGGLRRHHRLGLVGLRRRECKPGENVAVIGIGGIGAARRAGRQLAGARNIIAIDPVEFKRERGQEVRRHPRRREHRRGHRGHHRGRPGVACAT